MRRIRVTLLVLAGLAWVGCDGTEQPLEPAIQAAGAAGPKVTAPSNTNTLPAPQTRIDVSWRDNSPNETGFEVHRSTAGANGAFTLLASTGAGVTSHSDAGLAPSTQYCYKVRAFKRADGKTSYSDFSNTSCTTTPAPPVPAAPGGVDAKPVNSTSVEVRWIDNPTNEDGFRIERSPNPGSTWVTTGSVSPNVTSLIDGGLASEQQVCYRVIAFNAGGNSPPSNDDCTIPPAAPTGLSATVVDEPAVVLEWTDNSSVEDGYEVRRDGWIVATLPANTTGYRDAAVTPENPYGYVVRATKDGGSSGNSNVVQVVVATVPPAAPSGADAVPSGSAVATVTWVDNATNESGFRVERATDGGASWVAAGTAGLDEIGFYDFEQASEHTLCYRVIAFNSQGDSPPSNTDCTTLPAAPSDLLAIAAGMMGEVITLGWADNSGVEDGYEVQRWFSYCDDYHGCYSAFEMIATLGPNATSYSDWDVLPGNTYTYRVVALKEDGRSDPSNEATVYGQ